MAILVYDSNDTYNHVNDEIRGMLRSDSSAQWMGAGKWKVKIEGVLRLDTPTTSYHICGVQQGKGHDTKFRKTLAWLRGIGAQRQTQDKTKIVVVIIRHGVGEKVNA